MVAEEEVTKETITEEVIEPHRRNYMIKTYSNRCSRCGRERVVSKIWEERVGESVIQNTEKICPNKDCQKEVERENKKQSDKYAAMRLRSEQRNTQRIETNRLKKMENKAK